MSLGAKAKHRDRQADDFHVAPSDEPIFFDTTAMTRDKPAADAPKAVSKYGGQVSIANNGSAFEVEILVP